MMNHRWKFSYLLTLMLLVGFGVGIFFVTSMGAGSARNEPDQPPAAVAQATPQQKELLNQFTNAFESAAAKINPSVVPIFSESVTKVRDPFAEMFGDDFMRRFFGGMPGGGEQKQTVRSLGSGVIVSKDGYILTNNHVVEGAEKLTVELQSKKKVTAKVVGRDPQSDIAVVKVDASDLPAASLGNSDNVRVGQWVIAIGNPFQLMHTVTAGIISAKGRSSADLPQYQDFIQTDAAINPGNSGGALADLDGNVIGINTAILSPNGGGNVGIGFAVPINMAKSIMQSLIDKGKVVRGYLGLYPQDIDEALMKAMGLKSTDGALVGEVTSDSPAEKAGIKQGDIITEFNGTHITDAGQLRNLVAQASPGSSAKVSVLREGKTLNLTVTLGERPTENAAAGGGEDQGEQQSSKKLGLTLQTLNKDLADQLGYKNAHGVVVTGVDPGSPADDAGLRVRDLIKEANRQKISSVSDFEKAIRQAGKGGSVALLVQRGQNSFFVAIQTP